MYDSVLGYVNNDLISKHQEIYFQQLLEIFYNIDFSQNFKDSFQEKPLEQQKNFLLHPDISSLLQDISKEDSHDKLLHEVEYFLKSQEEKLVMNQGLHIPGTNIKLTLDDNNPQNMQVGHPDHNQDGMLGWGDKSQEEWLDVFAKAFELLKNIDRGFFDELNSIIKKIVPMKTSVDVHNSCSYKECIGTLYLGYTINSDHPELNILEALIHESSHNKLNLIMQSEKLHINDYSLKFYSPYRPDARHIQGVLLGVHAIVPTVYVMLEGIKKGYINDSSWNEKILLYHVKNKLGYRVLGKYGKFTTAGKRIYEDMGEVIKICDQLIKSDTSIQQVDFSAVQIRAKEHFLEVKTNYPYLQY